MKIGFDFDGIFIGTPPLVSRNLLERFYKAKDNGVLLYRIPSYPEQIFRKATHFPLFRPAIKDNLDLLKSISKKDNELYLISSRYKFLEDITNKLIKRYELNKVFDGLYFNYENKQAHLFKNEVIKGLGLDLFIDDDLSLIKYVAKHNPKTKFYWLNHQQEEKQLAKNVFSIFNLPDILEHQPIVMKHRTIVQTGEKPKLQLSLSKIKAPNLKR